MGQLANTARARMLVERRLFMPLQMGGKLRRRIRTRGRQAQ